MLSILIFLTWVLALARTLTNLFLVHRLSADAVPEREPFVSIIIPARNEARAIEATIRGFLAQEYGNFEVIVVDDRSTDGTGAIARSFDDPRLAVVDGEETPPGWLGKPWALHQGSLRARGEHLLFVDADVRYAPRALRAAIAHFARGETALLSLFPYIEMHGFWENVAMPQLAYTGFVVLPVWLSNRTRISALAVGGGPGNLIRRDVYDRIGGHVALKNAIIDDIGLAKLARRAGHATEVVRADTLVALRMYHGAGEILRGFTKNLFAALGRSYLLATALIILMIACNLLPYALVWTGDRFAVASVVLITLVRLALFGSLRYRLDNALFGHPFMTAFWLLIFVRSVWQTGIRRQVEWRGRTYDAR